MQTVLINVIRISLVAFALCVHAVSQQELDQATNDGMDAAASGTEISFREMVEHFLSGSRVIRYSGRSERIPLRVVVTREGTVQSAAPELENPKWLDQAVSLAKTWRYVPFQRNGKPVLATFSADKCRR